LYTERTLDPDPELSDVHALTLGRSCDGNVRRTGWIRRCPNAELLDGEDESEDECEDSLWCSSESGIVVAIESG
jgi:hypothetical protein